MRTRWMFETVGRQVAVLAALLTSRASAPAQGVAPATLEAFALPLDGCLMIGEGASVAYRFRRVHFEEHGDPSTPGRIQDGVVSLRFDAWKLWLDETFVDLERSYGYMPTPRRVTSCYSLASGTYARALHQSADVAPTVLVERWRGLPSIVFNSLGLLGPRAALLEAEYRGESASDDGTRVVALRTATGTECAVRVREGAPGALVAIQSRSSDGGWTDWTHFLDCVEVMPGAPARPRGVVEAREDASGRVIRVCVWQQIEPTRMEAPGALPPGARFADHRAPSADAASPPTDRLLALDEFFVAPGALVEAFEHPAPTVARAELFERARVLDAAPKDRQGAAVSLAWVGGGAALLVLSFVLGGKRS